jgi:Heparan-alpha-glucosaminide N-acetyltransferase, catalytic
MPSAVNPSPRLLSLDQFRGYTIVGMCVANFLAPFSAIHSIFKHNDTYFSYADTIMPGFLFIVGFAFRLTYLKRRRKSGLASTAASYVRRSANLLLLSLLIYLFVGDIPRWFRIYDVPPEFSKISQSALEGGTTAASDSAPLAAAPAPLVSAQIERLRDWRGLGWPRRLLFRWRVQAARLVKSELWETLAIIGATQLVILPWIGCRLGTRLLVMAALGATHCLLSYWFAWDFLYAVKDNWMSNIWMTGDDRGWDGGIFGPINWGIAMLGGTIAYDLVTGSPFRAAAVRKLTTLGIAFLAAGYALSCLTRLYDLSPPERDALRQRHIRQAAEKTRIDEAIAKNRAELKKLQTTAGTNSPADTVEAERLQGTILAWEELRRLFPDLSLATNPVLPAWDRWKGRPLGAFFAEPPFIAPPADDPRVDPPPWIEHRLRNYWMLGKRMPNLSFMIFATGFQFVLLGLFVSACDMAGWQLGLFRTLWTNPLAAYFIHGMMALVLALALPHDAPLTWCLAGFAAAFLITYLLVRELEKRGLYWRL